MRLVFFFFLISGGNLEQWWRSNVESQTETNGKTKGLNTKRRERERVRRFLFVGFRDKY